MQHSNLGSIDVFEKFRKYFYEHESGFVSNCYFCGLQVIVNPAETRNASGSPVDFEDHESVNGPFPKDWVEPEGILTEQNQQVSIIEVRWCTHCGSLSGRAAVIQPDRSDH